VALADADPSASALEWSDQVEGFPFRVAGLPVKDFHKRADDFARDADVVIGDIPQAEDHAGIARSAMRWADELIVPVAPTTIELDRTGPIMEEIENLEAVRPRGARSAFLLTRVVNNAASGLSARRVLAAQGQQVLSTVIPRLEVYAQAFGTYPEKFGAYDAARHRAAGAAHEPRERRRAARPGCSGPPRAAESLEGAPRAPQDGRQD
jgi:chromosome partitioning protein